MIALRYSKTKTIIASVLLVMLYLMELPGLLEGLLEIVAALTAMNTLGMSSANVPLLTVLAMLMPVISRMVFLLFYLKLLLPLPARWEHRKVLLVLVVSNISLSAANVLVSGIANKSPAGSIMLALLLLVIAPSVLLLIGLIARRSTEWLAAAARLISLGIAVVQAAVAGLWPSPWTILIAGMYIAVLLLHPLLERPMLPPRATPQWDVPVPKAE